MEPPDVADGEAEVGQEDEGGNENQREGGAVHDVRPSWPAEEFRRARRHRR